MVDRDALAAADAGRQLAAAAEAAVLWPTSVAWPPQITAVFPKQLPPLRSDRETIVVGTAKANGPLSVDVSTEGIAGPEKLTFSASAVNSGDANNYLAQLVDRAKVDGGATLPLVGKAGLAELRQEINAGVRNLDRLARQALANNNLGGAEQLAGEALRQDPNDTEALAVRSAVAKRRQQLAAGRPPVTARKRSSAAADRRAPPQEHRPPPAAKAI